MGGKEGSQEFGIVYSTYKKNSLYLPERPKTSATRHQAVGGVVQEAGIVPS